MIKLNSNLVFSVVLAFFFVLMVKQMIPAHVDDVMELVLSKNRTHIKSMNQTRSIGTVKRIKIDKVDLHDKNRFFHPALGKLGWDNDFWADIETEFTVKTEGNYRFIVGSDDGFTLSIDGKELCSFKGDRGYSKQTCPIHLSKGEHTLNLSYFQGYGNAGLTLQYQAVNKDKLRFWGEDSKHVKIKN